MQSTRPVAWKTRSVSPRAPRAWPRRTSFASRRASSSFALRVSCEAFSSVHAGVDALPLALARRGLLLAQRGEPRLELGVLLIDRRADAVVERLELASAALSIAFSTFALASPAVSRSSAPEAARARRARRRSRGPAPCRRSRRRRRKVVAPNAPRRASTGVTQVSSTSATTAAVPGIERGRDLVDEVEAHAGLEQVVHDPAEAADVGADGDAGRSSDQPDETAGDDADERSRAARDRRPGGPTRSPRRPWRSQSTRTG